MPDQCKHGARTIAPPVRPGAPLATGPADRPCRARPRLAYNPRRTWTRKTRDALSHHRPQDPIMATRLPLLLWTNEADVYVDAVREAGLGDRVELTPVRVNEQPPPELARRVEAMLAWRVSPGTLPHMSKLRWVQSLTGGMEGWLALPDLPPHLVLTCARGTHRVQMPENILGALFHLTKPFTAITLDQRERRWTRRVSEPLAS